MEEKKTASAEEATAKLDKGTPVTVENLSEKIKEEDIASKPTEERPKYEVNPAPAAHEEDKYDAKLNQILSALTSLSIRQSDLESELHSRDTRLKSPQGSFVYVLLLEGGNFYVGYTNNLAARLEEHKVGGSQFTRLHKFNTGVHWSFPGNTEDEDFITLALMLVFGPEKVRGGQWARVGMADPPIVDAAKTALKKCMSERPIVSPSKLPWISGIGKEMERREHATVDVERRVQMLSPGSIKEDACYIGISAGEIDTSNYKWNIDGAYNSEGELLVPIIDDGVGSRDWKERYHIIGVCKAISMFLNEEIKVKELVFIGKTSGPFAAILAYGYGKERNKDAIAKANDLISKAESMDIKVSFMWWDEKQVTGRKKFDLFLKRLY